MRCGEWRPGSTGRLVCDVVTMRTSRFTGAAAFSITLTLLSVAPAAGVPVQVEKCPEQQLGPASACLAPDDGVSVTTVAPDDPESDPGAALWVGAAFGAAGLAGIVFATARVRDTEPVS